MLATERSQDKLALLLTRLDSALDALAQAPAFAKPGKLPRVFDTARRVMREDVSQQDLEQVMGYLQRSWGASRL